MCSPYSSSSSSSSQEFLNSLAFKVFNCTQYIRHHEDPSYSPEPDLVHEIYGHVPMLLDPEFAEFSQQIGLLSIGAPDEVIKQLAAVYFYMVEFGGIKQEGQMKVFGGAIASSLGEMKVVMLMFVRVA